MNTSELIKNYIEAKLNTLAQNMTLILFLKVVLILLTQIGEEKSLV